MKKLTEMQKNFIIKSALNSGDSMDEAIEKVAAEEARLNKPKSEEAKRLMAYDDSNESGFM